MIPKVWTKYRQENIAEYDETKLVCRGPDDTWASINFENNSNELIMIALDYACKVATTKKGQLKNCTMSIIAHDTINDKEYLRHTATAGQTWTRVFIPLPRGRFRIRFRTDHRYGESDEVYMRDINLHRFRVSKYVNALEANPVESNAGTQVFETLGGTLRTQRIGTLTSKIEMTLTFTNYDNYSQFLGYEYDGYMMIETPYGIYGGHMQEMKADRSGTLRFIECTLGSAQRAGRGVDEM